MTPPAPRPRRPRDLLTACALALAAAAPAAAQETLRGTVLDRDLRPLAGASVGRIEDGAAPEPLATTAEDGTWTVPWTPELRAAARRGAELVVTAQGRCGAAIPMAPISFFVPDEREMPLLVMDRAVTLHGRVRGPDGRPRAGATVHAADLGTEWLWWERQWQSWSRGVTGDDGIFRLPGLPAAGLELRVEAEGHFTATVAPVALGTPLEIALAPSATFAGTVVDPAGAPVAAMVEVEYEGRPERERLRTGADGRFTATWRHRARARLHASVGEPPRLLWHGEVLEAPPEALQIRLRPLDEAPMLRVRATGDDGAPLRDFRTAVAWIGAPMPDEILWQVMHADGRAAQDGVAHLPPPRTDEEQTGSLILLAPGRALTVAEAVWDPGSDGSTVLTVATAPARRLRGTVVEADGTAVRGAEVWAMRVHEVENWILEGEHPAESVAAGADGTFELDHLAPGRWIVHCRHGGRRLAKPVPVAIPAEGEHEPLRLELVPGVRAAGTCAGAAPGWQIAFANATTPRPGPFGRLPTDCRGAVQGDGTFAVEGVRPGNRLPILVVPRPPRGGPELHVMLPARRVPQEGTDDLDLDGIDGPGLLRGTVSFTGAAPPPERLLVQLTSRPLALQPDAMWPFELWHTVGTVGADGRIAIPVAPGHHRVRVIDAWTRIPLATAEDGIEVRAGRTEEFALAAELCELQVELVPGAAGDRGVGCRLFYVTDSRAEQDEWGRPGPGIDPRCAPRATRWYVPPGPATLRLACAALPEDPAGNRWPTPPEVDAAETVADFDARPGRPAEVRVQVPQHELR